MLNVLFSLRHSTYNNCKIGELERKHPISSKTKNFKACFTSRMFIFLFVLIGCQYFFTILRPGYCRKLISPCEHFCYLTFGSSYIQNADFCVFVNTYSKNLNFFPFGIFRVKWDQNLFFLYDFS